jgi:quercetin dioxygenase-like cupin family protein
MQDAPAARRPVVIAPDQGRLYPMGRMRAVFKADGDQTADRYSVSEWWLEPRTRGPGDMHAHEEDHLFYVLAGIVSLCLDGVWSHAPQGAYVVIPGGTPHTFENRGDVPAGFMSFNTPGGFEARMPDIAAALSAEDLRL